MGDVEFICPALRDRLEGLESVPPPAELSWDICSNGGVSILFSFLLFLGFFFAVRFTNGETWGSIMNNPLAQFVPPSLRFFVAFIGSLSFILTAPMFFTRFNTGRWTGKFVMQQLMPDAFARLVGCEPLNGGNTTYLLYPLAGEPDDPNANQVEEFDYNRWTDIAFLPHASFGILWDFFGTIHIFLATYASVHVGNPSFHKKLGYFSICIFTCHMLGATHILYRNVVFHNAFPRFSLFADVIQSSAYIFRALQAILDRNNDRKTQVSIHKVLMFFGFVHAIEGSGQIRFTAWWIWLISRFIPMRYAVYFDTTVCQGSNYATCPRASAGNCVLAYMIRMNFLRMTTIYWKLCFFRIQEFAHLVNTKAYVKEELTTQVKTFGILVLAILWIEFRVDERYPWLNAFFSDNLYSLLFFGIPVLMRLNERRKYILWIVVAALIWNSSPFTPTFLSADWVWFLIGSFFFGYTTKEYVDEIKYTITESTKKE